MNQNVQKNWSQSDSIFRPIEGNASIIPSLPLGIYNVHVDQFGRFFLQRFADKFTFEYKLYDLMGDLVDHVLKTYNNTEGNLGVLLNGLKGTGKTVTAKVIANKVNLPIINVSSFGDNNQELVEFLSGITCDCVLFFDEFEKKFSEEDHTILQLMDGVVSGGSRKLFLLTTNDLTVNDNLISRPSRVRYIQSFGNLREEIIEKFLKDNLKDCSKIDELISYITSLSIVTMDIIKTIAEDVNVHGIEDFLNNSNIFNVKPLSYNYDVYRTRIRVKDLAKEIELFKTSIERYKLRPADFGFNPNYDEELDKWEKTMTGCFRIDDTYLFLRKNFSNLKVGEEINMSTYGEDFVIIAHVDTKDNILVTVDASNNRYATLYKILNPDTKPSLYKNNFAL